MNIIVCVKQVPDTNEVRIDKKTNNLMREGVPGILNPYDQNSVEMALGIREKTGGKVTVVSMGPRQTEEAIQYCLDMGADEGILLSDRAAAGSDTLATGYILSGLVSSMQYDLVMCGNEAIDGCTGQVGPIIAGNLGLKQFTCVTDLEVKDGKALIQRTVGKNLEFYEAEFPMVVCVRKDINQPRKAVPSGRTVRVMDAGSLGLDMERIGNHGSPTKVVEIRMSDARVKSYFTVDDTLPWEERIRFIINGGIEKKEKVELWRGEPQELSRRIAGCAEVSRFIENVR